MTEEKLCTCGDTEDQHVDGCEQCVVPGCGCKEFEEVYDCDMCEDTGMVNKYTREDGGYVLDSEEVCLCKKI